jgi:NADPH:quinone reductase-like Zn-dependent oxidoreductase
MKAVRFEQYGDIDVLEVVDVERPTPGAGETLIRVKAAGTNPGEASIRKGLMHERFPATFPSGQGTDFAGVVEEVGENVQSFSPGDEVIGYTDNRASQAEFVVVPSEHVTAKPAEVPWEVAGALHVAGATAVAAVRAVAPRSGDHVVVSGAAGGVGSIAVQLARRTGAEVFGIAGEHNHEWLREHGVIPVDYGEDLADQLQEAAAHQIDAFIDTFGGGYVELAINLGVAPERIDTIIDFEAAQRYGVKTEGNQAAAGADTLAELASLIVQHQLEVPIAATYPLDRVHDAYRELEQRHTRGKIVLIP